MNFVRPSLLGIILSSLAVSGLHAQDTATTDPVGFMTFATPPATDVRLAPPLTQAPAFQGSGTASGFVVTASPSPGWTTDEFSSTPHYLQIVGGAQDGMLFDIASNTADTLSLVDNGVPPTGIDGNTFKVVKYNTLISIFPADQAGVSFQASASAFVLGTQIIFPNLTGTGINRSAPDTYYFLGGYWRKVGSGSANFDNTPILPDSFIIVRNTASAPANLAVTVAGSVSTSEITVPLTSAAGTQNDNYVATSRPADQTLESLGLISSGAFEPSVSAFNLKDQLLVFNNEAPGINKSASATYYYLGGTVNQWRRVGGGTANVGTDIIPAGAGVVVRKASAASESTSFWNNSLTLAP